MAMSAAEIEKRIKAAIPDAVVELRDLAGSLERQVQSRTAELMKSEAALCQSQKMEALERRILASLGIGDPYAASGTVWPSLTLAANRYPHWSPVTGSARVRWVPRDGLRVDAEWSREVIETPLALSNRVTVDVAALGAEWRPDPRWSAAVSLAALRFDDGNQRHRINGRVDYALRFRPKVVVGLEGQAFSSSDPTGPQRAAHAATGLERFVALVRVRDAHAPARAVAERRRELLREVRRVHDDIDDPGARERFEVPHDERLAADREQRLRRGERQGPHALAAAGGEDERPHSRGSFRSREPTRRPSQSASGLSSL